MQTDSPGFEENNPAGHSLQEPVDPYCPAGQVTSDDTVSWLIWSAEDKIDLASSSFGTVKLFVFSVYLKSFFDKVVCVKNFVRVNEFRIMSV